MCRLRNRAAHCPISNLPGGYPVSAKRLVAFPSMLEGQKIEPAELAYDTAVELSARALEPTEDPARDVTEPLHDALSRLGALSAAGRLGKVS